MTNHLPPELLQLSVAERIQLAEDLWDSVAQDAAQLPISEAQRKELERRLARFAEDPATRPWEIVKQELSNR
ncbi:MAG: addiction module protein [Acidobacteria bacterium]|nr:addiction module protein [Acidobacteriota bacterium]MBI3424692.1 addiction module protein [Acidobacteriota bacterium]